MQETHVRSLGQEDPLEKGLATYSSSLSWRIPWTEEPGRLQSMGLQRFRHNWVTNICTPHAGLCTDALWLGSLRYIHCCWVYLALLPQGECDVSASSCSIGTKWAAPCGVEQNSTKALQLSPVPSSARAFHWPFLHTEGRHRRSLSLLTIGEKITMLDVSTTLFSDWSLGLKRTHVCLIEKKQSNCLFRLRWISRLASQYGILGDGLQSRFWDKKSSLSQQFLESTVCFNSEYDPRHKPTIKHMEDRKKSHLFSLHINGMVSPLNYNMYK